MNDEFAMATALVSVLALFFFSISGFCSDFMQLQKGFYYRVFSFILRQFNARVNTAWVFYL